MGLRVCILGSGSSGNCAFVGSESTGILIDAGLSAREIARRLGEIGAGVPSISAVCVSHEHNDHTAGLRILHEKHGISVYANQGTVEGLSRDARLAGLRWTVFTTGAPFDVGDMTIEPFSVSHDAFEPVGFAISSGSARVGIVTDIGTPTTLVRERLKGCHAVVVESNHDEQMLRDAARPWHLKQRISGRQGHLSNRGAAAMICDIAGPQLHHVFLAHLSEECNRPELARRTASEMLAQAGHGHVKVSLTFPDKVSEVWAYSSA
jgi:phosphoribosyl 1,2-cyclic phosphodiesterase